MYGFRKVMNLESGLVKSDRATAIEFQHPCFKKGKAELLEFIKRKISSVKSGDLHLSQEELQKVFYELQELKEAQGDVDTQLHNMRRENEALWKEVSSLRRKHSQQQKLLAKILQFIIGLMRGNIVMGNNRKRTLKIEASQPPSKYARHVLHFPEDTGKQMNRSSQHPGNSTDDGLIIHEVLSPGEGTSSDQPTSSEQLLQCEIQHTTQTNTETHFDEAATNLLEEPVLNAQLLEENQAVVPSIYTNEDWLALDVIQANSSEDTDSVINSIINENNSVSSADMLDCEDIQDFLSCIDASLEDLQTMLSKKINVEADIIEGKKENGKNLPLFQHQGQVLPAHRFSAAVVIDPLQGREGCQEGLDIKVTETNASLSRDSMANDKRVVEPDLDDLLNKDKQLMHYTGNPLLSLFDELESNNSVSSAPTDLLTGKDDNLLTGSSEELRNNSLSVDTSKEADLLVEDTSGAHDPMPIFVLSPVNKLLDEVTESDTHV
ncbi:heat shock factor 3-like [Pelobates cultripes]|uniref:Heat shock factor 3-like n=1 Tax=Pelobates cultripes TaxID=61616 RepID=A0AAD1WNX9_PELCU|nr:heat shock factor 3-like [Pelobates cultripes]